MECDDSSISGINKGSQLSIEHLSDDTLYEIFNCLDKGALKRSSRVCQRWNNLIINSKVLTQRLTLFFISDTYIYPLDVYEDQFNDLLEKSKEFPYRNFRIYIREPQTMDIWNEIQDKFFEIIKNPLKLKLSSVPKLIVSRAVQLSGSTLTHLQLCYDSDRNSIEDLPFEFPNLVTLKLFEHLIPRSLKAPKLREIDYDGANGYLSSDTRNLAEFLCKFDNLKKLRTCFVPTFHKGSIKFQLEELIFRTNGFDMEAMKDFLISQQKSLKKLELFDDDIEDCREFLNIPITSTKLEELYISSRYDRTYQPQQIEDVNYSIKKLKFTAFPGKSPGCDWPHPNYVNPILRNFRGMEILRFMAMHSVQNLFVDVDLSNLKEIDFGFLDDNSFEGFSFAQFKLERLEKVSISSIKDNNEVKNLLKVTSFCPNLKILYIGTLDYGLKKKELFKQNHLETLFKYSPNIVDFVVGGCPYLLSSFMFSIKTVKSNLQRLKVGVYCDDRIPEMLKKLEGAKFICDLHYYKIIGMKPVPWHEREYDSRKDLGED